MSELTTAPRLAYRLTSFVELQRLTHDGLGLLGNGVH